jgi:hypothetical protein
MTENPVPLQPPVVVADPSKPWKALVPIVLGVVYAVWQAVAAAMGAGPWTTQDTVTVVGAAITALIVYLVPNPQVVKE